MTSVLRKGNADFSENKVNKERDSTKDMALSGILIR